MNKEIQNNLNNPEKLERLYRKNKQKFQEEFLSVSKSIDKTPLIEFWNIRFRYAEPMGYITKSKLNIIPLLISCFIIVLLMRLADIFSLSPIATEMYEYRNPVMFVFLGLMLYEFLKKRKRKLVNSLGNILVYVILALQLNTLPDVNNSQLLQLALLHTPIFLWFLYGLLRCHSERTSKAYWVKYLRYNGDLLVFGGIIAICWAAIFSISIGLFESLHINFNETNMTKWFISALAVTPVLGVFAIERASDAAEKIVPLIARIFNPIVLIVLILYVSILFRAGENLYGERDFLLLINVILFSVLAIILFSISNMPQQGSDQYRFFILYMLTLLSCSLNMLAISAIIYRIVSYGISPNRLAVAGANLIVFINLIKVGIDLLKVHAGKRDLGSVVEGIAGYLPVYGIWAVVVIIVFPILFL